MKYNHFNLIAFFEGSCEGAEMLGEGGAGETGFDDRVNQHLVHRVRRRLHLHTDPLQAFPRAEESLCRLATGMARMGRGGHGKAGEGKARPGMAEMAAMKCANLKTMVHGTIKIL